MCFNNIRTKTDNVSIIELVVDDLYVANESDKATEIKRRILNVINKIKRECTYIMEHIILVDKKASQYVVVRNVEIVSNEVSFHTADLRLESKNLVDMGADIDKVIILSSNEEVLRKKRIVLVITALEKELRPLLNMIAFPLSLGRILIDNNVLYTLDITSECTLVSTSFRKMGTVSAALSMQSVLNHFDVSTVVLTGICGGLDESLLDYGDIIISEQIIDYEIAKLTDKTDDIRWEVYRSNDHLRRGLLNSTSLRWKDYIKRTFPDINKVPNVYSGPVLSGNKILASSYEKDKLLSHWRKALAIEMEAAGISAALHTLKRPPSFVMVKPIPTSGSTFTSA